MFSKILIVLARLEVKCSYNSQTFPCGTHDLKAATFYTYLLGVFITYFDHNTSTFRVSITESSSELWLSLR